MRKDKPIKSRNIMDIYALGYAPYASKNRVKGVCLRPRRKVGLGWTGGRGETGGFLRGSNGR